MYAETGCAVIFTTYVRAASNASLIIKMQHMLTVSVSQMDDAERMDSLMRFAA